MKSLWVDAGNDPDWAKVESHQITHLFFALYDPRVTRSYLSDVAAKGYGTGVYVVSTSDSNSAWAEFGPAGKSFADKVSAKVTPLIVSPSKPKVQLDMEEHDAVRVLEALEQFRMLHPKQDVSWTMEAGQGGWMTPEFVDAVLKCKVRLVPQCYNGAMTEVWDALTFARDLTKRGFPDSIISPFYDAAHLPVGWDGFAFTMGRLP